MATMQVSNFDGDPETIEKPLAPGRLGAASSRPVALSVEDKAAIDNLVTAATNILAKFPAAAGAGGGIKVDGSGTAIPVSGTVAVTGAGDIGSISDSPAVPNAGASLTAHARLASSDNAAMRADIAAMKAQGDDTNPLNIQGEDVDNADYTMRPVGGGVLTKATAPTASADGKMKRWWGSVFGAGNVQLTFGAIIAPITAAFGLKVEPLSSVLHGDTDAGGPLKFGGKIVEALSAMTLLATGKRTDASFDRDGVMIVRSGGAIADRVSNSVSNTSGAVQDCIAAQASGIAVNLTDVTLTNTHLTQFVDVDIYDGATFKWNFPVPPQGGVTHRFETPLKGSAATAWRFDPSAATTTIKCSMSGRLTKL